MLPVSDLSHLRNRTILNFQGGFFFFFFFSRSLAGVYLLCTAATHGFS